MGKKVASAAVSVGVGAAFNGVGKITETVNAAGKTVKVVEKGGLSKMLAGKLGDGFGQVALDAGLAGVQTYTSVVASSFVGAIGSDDYWGTVGEAAWSTGTLANVVSAGAGSLAGDMLNKLNLGDKLEKVLGFNAGQIGEMQQFNAFAGSLAGAGLGYAISGEMTLNVLNLKDLSGGALGPMGLLEMRIGGEDGFSMGMGTGGTDISFGTVATAMAGLGHWGMNIDIEAAARRNAAMNVVTGADMEFATEEELRGNMTKNAATAMRGAYGFGDGTDLAQLDSILRGGTVLLAGGAGEGGQTTTVGGTRYVTLNGMKEAATSGQQLSLSLTLSHEARRDGIADGNRAETREATLAHTEMALRMLGDGATSSIMKEVIDASENLQMDLGKYMTAKLRGDDTLFDKYVDGTYDSSADYWRLIKNENGEYGFAWDGNLNIYGEDGNRTDRNAGLLLDYREIQGVLDKDKGKTKITLAEDIEVNYGALETVQGINQTIIASSVWDRSMATIAGGGKSGAGAADALLGDGFMSEDETIDAAGRVLSRYASSRLGLTMIEHYSVRSVFDEMGQALFDGREIMSDIPTSFGLFNGDGLMGRLMGEFSDRYHEMGNERRSDDFLEGNGNDKYVRPYGGESILSGTTYEVVLNMFGEVVTDPVNRGTFNFAPETGHFNLDMVPYYKWGNDPIDRLTTTLIDRVLGVYRGPIPKGIF